MPSIVEELRAESAALRKWLECDALPLWETAGIASGGFVETVAMDGTPTRDNVRARVNPRQVYCFAEAGRRDWPGDWMSPVESGLARLEQTYRLESGLYGHLATVDGELIDRHFDLYNHAFVLLAWAAVAAAVPARYAEMNARAEALLGALKARFAHDAGGFLADGESSPVMRANPHMHLFEAALAWKALGGEVWAVLADELAGLVLERMCDPLTGAVREFFDLDWKPVEWQGHAAVEPGHQFEWAWLLLRWQENGGAVADTTARLLFENASARGIDPNRNTVIMGLTRDLECCDTLARLWSQTEWLKAAMMLAARSKGSERASYLSSGLRAARTIRRFLDVETAGLWHDKQRADGSFVEEPAPASTFYHLVCAIYEMADRLDDIPS